jgi:exopolysaccharide biosynthesis polyprenyl glycosylphosphotransferase
VQARSLPICYRNSLAITEVRRTTKAAHHSARLPDTSEGKDNMEEFWQGLVASISSSPRLAVQPAGSPVRNSRGKANLWMALDVVTIFGSAVLVTLYRMDTDPVAGAKGFWNGTLIQGRSMGILLAFLCGFCISLIITSRRLHLYTPMRLSSILHEQKLSVQACFTAGLLLTGALYLIKAGDIPRSIVLITVGLVTISLSVRRLVYRLALYRAFGRGQGTRNVLIVGTGPEAQALRHHLESIRRLGYTFKGFVDFGGSGCSSNETSDDVVGTLETLFNSTRRHFVDEIFLTNPCERGVIKNVLEQARIHGVDLRVVPDMYDGHTLNSPIEYVGQFPTIPLHCGHMPEVALVLKRGLDIAISSLALLVLSPLLVAIAIAVKLDSHGPVFYYSERLGKKGLVFRCVKFRTMIRDAEQRRADMMHMNERDGVLFKISNDPRITRLGRFLRKYSLDELPQFFNVLRGDMSIVGPRPPLASEVQEYKLSHLRRLDVNPGITGLWQVQARQDPSFDSYISLDVAYIENWSLLLDLKIIARTVGVVLAGTGS